MNLTRPVNQQDVDQLQAADARLQAIGIDTDNLGYTEPIINYLNQNPTVPITADNIVAFVNANKQLFTWRNATEREYDELVVKFSDYDRDFIAAKLGSYGYDTTEPNLLHNWNIVAREFLRRGYSVNSDNFKIVIGNLASGPQGHLLRVKPQQPQRKFDAAKAVQEQNAAPKVEPDKTQLTISHMGDDPNSWVRPLSPELRAHQDAVHAAMAQAEAAKQKLEEQQPQESSYWKGRVQQFLAWIPENVIRMELEPEFAKPKNGNWEFTYRELERAYNRRQYERSVDRGGNF